ncbi:MAG: trehalose-6-phosphate synthase [Anaerolineales bacterium]|nr:trehalose-6-phosphate synthase [Anaerolineales bacterium]
MYEEKQYKSEFLSEKNFTYLSNHRLIIASNRGPVVFSKDNKDELSYKRGSGGLITALSGLLHQVDFNWVACAQSEEDSIWKEGAVSLGVGRPINVSFLSPQPKAYNGYYNTISNPLLWFLQHSMWDVPRQPIIDKDTWDAWDNGYIKVNKLFAEKIIQQTLSSRRPVLVMLQDYHLYLAARYIYEGLPPKQRPTTSFFVHIPWPGPEYWGILPQKMRQSILDGLCAVDMMGFQTQEDGLNFIRTCQTYLPRAHVNFKHGRIWYCNHATYVRDFPISIDVDSVKSQINAPDILALEQLIRNMVDDKKLILRIDRLEPSKNIIRGFKAYEEMLEIHPEHREKVQFLALISPSRMEVLEYQHYLDEIMAMVGQINANFGTSTWEPVRILVGEDYQRALAAMKLYDVLLVNSVTDGMNLVAKEGPIMNQKNGVLILSERAGASQQLGPGAKIISPFDIYATAEAIHQALNMGEDEKREKAYMLRHIIENNDIHDWFYHQLETVIKLDL